MEEVEECSYSGKTRNRCPLAQRRIPSLLALEIQTRPIGRSLISSEIRALVRRMATENNWGAPRIHAELLKLGFRVSERTVSRYMPKKPAPPDALKNWMTFLKNHRDLIAGIDFFTDPTITFSVLYVFFIIMTCETTDYSVRCYNPSLFRMGCSAAQGGISLRYCSEISHS